MIHLDHCGPLPSPCLGEICGLTELISFVSLSQTLIYCDAYCAMSENIFLFQIVLDGVIKRMWPLKDVQVLISGTSDYAKLPVKGKLRLWME